MKKAGLVGVTGYTGMELCRLLADHGGLELVMATSRAQAGARLDQLYPGLGGTKMAGLVVCEPDVAKLAAECDVVFLAVPHGTAMDMAGQLLDAGARVVDLSADFRLRDKDVYAQWYGLEHRRPELLPDAVFGLPEFYRDAVRTARLIANPGCYPTASILALAPALRNQLAEPAGIVIDAKSGATGAGRKAQVGTLFCEVSDTFKPYNLGGKHRHTPEIEQELSAACGAAGNGLTVSFNPHLLPINRGILATAYTTLAKDVSAQDVWQAYQAAYDSEPWVRLLPLGKLPETRYVRGTNFCDVGIVVDERAGRLILVSAIDNLCRGASGQALVNANLMLGFAEAEGLPSAPLVP